MGASGSVTGPITDQLAFRLYAGRRVRDGFYNVDVGDGPRTLTDDNNQDFGTVRGQLLWLPNDNTSIRMIADYSKRDEYCCAAVQTRVGPTFPFIDGLSAGTGQRPQRLFEPRHRPERRGHGHLGRGQHRHPVDGCDPDLRHLVA
jgi:iron complex outermembrane receptor protein